MRKIATLFLRDPADMRRVLPTVTPGCEWVLAGEGTATRKYDGTCVRIAHEWHDGPQVVVDVRREVKPGKVAPPEFELLQHDSATGKQVGWEPYANSGFAKFIDEALGVDPDPKDWPEGTYELCGPRINKNPEGYRTHRLISHVDAEVTDLALLSAAPTPETALAYMAGALFDLGTKGWEGIVWHHPDGRMCKLKVRDVKDWRPT